MDSSSQIRDGYAGQTLLVTGGGGYLAGNLINALFDTDCTILRLTRQNLEQQPNKKARIENIVGDITDPKVLHSVLEGCNIVFHFAAQTDAYLADREPITDMDINVIPLVRMLDWCRRNNNDMIVLFAGTATEVGLTKKWPVNESESDHPVTVYDQHKLLGEKYLEFSAANGWMRGGTLRLPNIYGPGLASSSLNRGILNKMIREAVSGRYLTMYGGGQYIRDYLYVDDAVRAFLLAGLGIKNINGRHFNIGTGQGVELAKVFSLVVEVVQSIIGSRTEIVVCDPPEGLLPIEFRNYAADYSVFSEATGWCPTVELADGIKRTVEFMIEGRTMGVEWSDDA